MVRFLFAITVCFAVGCAQRRSGVLVMAHGGDAEWNRQIEATVAPLAGQYPTEIAFGMATPSTMESAIQRLEASGVSRIAVVRMFISGDSFTESTEYILGLRSNLSADTHAGHGMPTDAHASHATNSQHHTEMALASNAPTVDAHTIHLGHASDHHMEPPRRIHMNAQVVVGRDGVADSPLIDQILVDRVSALSRDPAKESILILGHGPGDDAENEQWLSKMALRSQGVRQLGSFRHIQCETLREDWPAKRAEAEKRIRQFVEQGNRDSGRVIVIPFRIAGFGPYKEVLDGLTYVADGRGFCPHPNMTRWLQETVAETLAAR